MVSLLLAMALAALVIYVPGGLVTCLLGVPRTWALCIAPALSLALFSLLGVLYAMVGVPANVVSMLALPLLMLAGAIALLWRKARSSIFDVIELPALSWKWLALYAIVGLGVCTFMFIRLLPAPDAIVGARDLPYHINQIRAFIDSGSLSSLRSDVNLASADVAVDPILPLGGIFYPSAWHAACALVVQLGSMKVALAINALTALLNAVSFPLAMLSLLAMATRGDKRVLFAGAFVCCAFVHFPWYMSSWGPLYPNLAGFCIMMGCAWPLMRFCDEGVSHSERLRLSIVILADFMGLALLHPNVLITLCLLWAPFACSRILACEDGWVLGGKVLNRWLVLAAFVLAALGLWLALYHAPFMQAVVSYSWIFNLSEGQTLINWLTLAFLNLHDIDLAQWAPAAMVVAGLVWSLRNRAYLWLVGSYLVGFAPYGLSVVFGEHRNLFSGFWYTDPPRLAAMATIAAIPVAAMGLAWCIDLCAKLFRLERLEQHSGEKLRFAQLAPACAAAAIFMLVAFFPGFYMPGAISNVEADPEEQYKTQTAIERMRETTKVAYSEFGALSRQERLFMDEVARIVGPDALVINQPYDGSVISYGDSGVRCYYRQLQGVASEAETKESRLIRTGLVSFATSKAVQEVVRELGAAYVVKLEHVRWDGAAFKWGYQAQHWIGIDAITPKTPGFELVKEEGEMQLYKIVG